jgi:hypothetical protein
MRFSLTRFAWLAAVIGLLMSCGSDPERTNFAYLRSPSFFRADTAATDHPLCDQPGSPFASPEECRKARKYKLSWLRPEDTAKLQGYRIYLDTTPADKKGWNSIRGRAELASVIITAHPLKDSLIFVFTNAPKVKMDTLAKDGQRIFALDSNGREEEETGRLMFGLVPVYSGDGTPGQPQFAFFKTTDKDPPDVFRADYKPLARGVAVAWGRPTDRVSFFNPSLDTGIIKAYRLEVSLGGYPFATRFKAFAPKLKSYRVGDSDRTAEVTDSLVLKDSLPNRMYYRLPDMHRSAKRSIPLRSDSLFVEIEGLFPRDTVSLRLFALDSAGNSNLNSMEKVSLHTTDTTQPSQPKLAVADTSLKQNGYIVTWSASRDSISGPGGALIEAPLRHQNIHAYRLNRTLIRAPGEKTTSLDQVDTVLLMDTVLAKLDSVRVPVQFLPPGTAFKLRIQAEDSSGFLSLPDTLTVSTRKVMFSGADSALVCPKGFIPMPRATFRLGDTIGIADEFPDVKAMGPYCIEPYEHRDSTGKGFVTNVSWDQARSICRAIDSVNFDTDLCSEAEWERACEGSNLNAPLAHGIQSEGKNPSMLQTSCNQSTNDSAMAMSFALRNSICLTTEGVYDMAGNLSEWVRDPYSEGAYLANAAKDTLDHAFTFADSLNRDRHGLRGGNYLKPNLNQTAEIQKLARCSNRDFPQQVRPKFREQCKDPDKPKVAIIYGSGETQHRCIDLLPPLSGADISEIIPDAKDSTNLLVFIKGQPKAHDFSIATTDTLFKGRRPLSARLTTRSLAAVVFERIGDPSETIPDTLDATEMRDTTQAGLAKIFNREAGSSGWTVRKKDGRYDIRFLYGYAYETRGTVPARKFYSSRVIGFRCCSLAK